jgi:hypothetical protein
MLINVLTSVKRYNEFIYYQSTIFNSKKNIIDISYFLQKNLPFFVYKNIITLTFVMQYFFYSLSKRFYTSSKIPLELSPELSLNDDYSIQNKNNHLISTKISLSNFFVGCKCNILNGLYYSKLNEEFDIKPDIKRYFINSQDFLLENGEFINNQIFKTNIIIKIVNSEIYVNDQKYDHIDEDLKKAALYELMVIQQHIQHLGLHLMATYGFNLLKNHHIDELIKNNIIIDNIFDFGNDIRNVTEGLGKNALFNSDVNSFGINEEEIILLVKFLSDRHLLLFENLLDKYLILDQSRDIYQIFQDKIKSNINDEIVKSIAYTINESYDQTFNLIINMIFIMSYFHNKSHIISIDINLDKSFTKYILINQVLYASEKQQLNSFLLDIKSDINAKYPDQSILIANAHIDI